MLTRLGQQSLILLTTSVIPYINIALGPYTNYTWIATSFSTAVSCSQSQVGSRPYELSSACFFTLYDQSPFPEILFPRGQSSGVGQN